MREISFEKVRYFEPLVSFRSMRHSHCTFRLAIARTETHRRSVLPSLLRFLVDPDSVRNELLLDFLQHKDQHLAVLCANCLMDFFFVVERMTFLCGKRKINVRSQIHYYYGGGSRC